MGCPGTQLIKITLGGPVLQTMGAFGIIKLAYFLYVGALEAPNLVVSISDVPITFYLLPHSFLSCPQVPMPEHLKHLPYDELQFTLVDCPGHASLIRTIIGGVQIIDMMILVVDITKGELAWTCMGLASPWHGDGVHMHLRQQPLLKRTWGCMLQPLRTPLIADG